MNEEIGGLVLNLEFTLEARPEEIFRLLTEPTELVTWWGPHGFTIPAVDLNLTVGGRYRFRMKPPDGEPFHLSGEFLEIDSPRRLAYTFHWEEPAPDDRESVVEISLWSAGDGTRVALSQGPFLSEERLDLHRNGWIESFEKLPGSPGWQHLRRRGHNFTMADPRVDHYISGLPPWQQAICQQVRELAHAADPDVEETIKRSVQPYFVLEGNICALLAAKDHVNVFLYDRGIVPDPDHIITAGHTNTTARTVAFHKGEVVNEEALVALFKAIIANNRAGGWRKIKQGK